MSRGSELLSPRANTRVWSSWEGLCPCRWRCGDAGSSPGILQLMGAHVASLASPGWLPERDCVYYGSHLLIKIRATEMVKGAQAFPFRLSWFHLLEALGFQAGFVQAEPARREIWEDCSGQGALPRSLREGRQKDVKPNVYGT